MTSISSGLKHGSTILLDLEGRLLKNFPEELVELNVVSYFLAGCMGFLA